MGNGPAIAAYIAETSRRALPPEVADMARLCLADWLGVAIGAADEPAGRIVREVAAGWHSEGPSTILFGGTAAAPFAALANGTLAHCLDFDDTYVKAITHTSAPVWAATLALGEEVGADEPAMLSAFVTGFETAGRIGSGLGEAVTARGWHGTGVFGRLGAAAAAAALLRLSAEQVLHALGAAATQTGLAAAGFTAATGLFEPGGGLDTALVQDRSVTFASLDTPGDLSGWRILDNSFKPYAACHLTHPAVDAARALASLVAEHGGVGSIRAEIGALAQQITGGKRGEPASPLEGKFDLKYCVALGLHGHAVSAADFREPWHPDPAICATAGKVENTVSPEMGFASARLTVEFADSRRETVHVPVAKGHPQNPMNWDDMHAKFDALVSRRLGSRSDALFELVRDFGRGDVLAEIRAMLARL